MSSTARPLTAPRDQPGASGTFCLQDLRNRQQLGSLHADGPVIVVPESILEMILEFSEQDQTRELGGFLLGGVHGQAPQCVLIRHFHPALAAPGNASSLTFTHDSWAMLTREMESSFPNESVIGWHHTHPGLGVFLSAYDLFIQKNFFSQPWQIALVVDPRRHEFGFYHWRRGEVRDCGFVCAGSI